jgi:hypothetical protein
LLGKEKEKKLAKKRFLSKFFFLVAVVCLAASSSVVRRRQPLHHRFCRAMIFLSRGALARSNQVRSALANSLLSQLFFPLLLS